MPNHASIPVTREGISYPKTSNTRHVLKINEVNYDVCCRLDRNAGNSARRYFFCKGMLFDIKEGGSKERSCWITKDKRNNLVVVSLSEEASVIKMLRTDGTDNPKPLETKLSLYYMNWGLSHQMKLDLIQKHIDKIEVKKTKETPKKPAVRFKDDDDYVTDVWHALLSEPIQQETVDFTPRMPKSTKPDNNYDDVDEIDFSDLDCEETMYGKRKIADGTAKKAKSARHYLNIDAFRETIYKFVTDYVRTHDILRLTQFKDKISQEHYEMRAFSEETDAEILRYIVLMLVYNAANRIDVVDGKMESILDTACFSSSDQEIEVSENIPEILYAFMYFRIPISRLLK